MSRLSGTVTLTGSGVENVPVAIIDTAGSSDPSQWTLAATTTTDANGDWEVTGLATNATERYHALVQYDDGAQLYNVESLPYLSTDAYLSAPITNWQWQQPTATLPSPTAPGALGQYKLDEGSGTTAFDSVGSNDLTISGASWVSGNGVGGYLLDFDGTDDEAVGNFFPELTGDFAHSLAFTIDLSATTLPSSTGGTEAINLVCNQGPTSTSDTLTVSIGRSSTSDIEFESRDSGGNVTYRAGIDISGVSGLNRVVVTHDGNGNPTVFLNGSQVTDTSLNANLNSNGPDSFTLGSADGTNYADTRLDNVIPIGEEWTTTEVSNDYNNQPWS